MLLRLSARFHAFLIKVPPFDRPSVRKRYVDIRSAAVRKVRRLLERLGIRRFSRPALHDLDRKLEPYLPTRPGVFVEAGANDGHLQSNTYYLERFCGWTGVLVEPIPELFEICRRERPNSRAFNCALVAPAAEGELIPMTYGGLMSVVAGAQGSPHEDRAHAQAGNMNGWDVTYDVDVPGRTLTSVLEEAGVDHVDLLSLDVEGHEADALRGLDLDRFPPRLALIEIMTDERRAAIEEILGDRYELVDRLSPHDYLYRHRAA
jgi:FkbM family methyltransferase